MDSILFQRIFFVSFFALVLTISAHADVRLEAVNQIDAAIVANLQKEIGSNAPAQTRFEARRQARRAAERLNAVLNSRGYFAARLRARVDSADGFQPVVSVDPGPRFIIGGISLGVQGDRKAGSQVTKLLEQIDAQIGKNALPDEILANERALVRAWKADGHPFAIATSRDILGDEDAATVEITYFIDPGPRVALGEVKFGSDNRLRQRFTQVLVPFEPGTLYHPELLTELNRRLGAVRVFAIYASRLSDTVSGNTKDGDEIRDIELTLIEDERYRISLGASYSTSEGLGASSQLVIRNLTRRADRLELDLTLATQERSFGADWLLPNGLGYGRDLWFSAEGSREETDAFDSNALQLSGGIDFHSNESQTYTVSLSNEFSSEKDAIGERSFHIFSVSSGASLDYTDNLLDPMRGWRVDLVFEPGYIFGDENTPFLSSVGEVSSYISLDEESSVIAATRSRLGVIAGADASEIPASRRFYAGGGGSARGFAFQAIGPTGDDGDPAGGRSLLEFSSELRWRASRSLGYAAFIDAASVSERDAPSFDDMRYGIGAGVRYFTAIGPIRLDVATPLDRRDGEDPFQVYISIGQAF